MPLETSRYKNIRTANKKKKGQKIKWDPQKHVLPAVHSKL